MSECQLTFFADLTMISNILFFSLSLVPAMPSIAEILNKHFLNEQTGGMIYFNYKDKLEVHVRCNEFLN